MACGRNAERRNARPGSPFRCGMSFALMAGSANAAVELPAITRRYYFTGIVFLCDGSD